MEEVKDGVEEVVYFLSGIVNLQSADLGRQAATDYPENKILREGVRKLDALLFQTWELEELAVEVLAYGHW